MTSAELLVRDTMLRNLPTRPAKGVAVVLIDEEAICLGGRWPWDRAHLARLVEQVISGGAKGVAIDLLLPEEREGDDLLARALGRGPSVLAAGVDDAGHWLLPNQVLQATPVGHVSFDLDRDGVVRRFSSTKQMEGRAFPALPVAAARLGNAQLPIPVGLMLRPAFRTRPIPFVSAASVLDSHKIDILRDRIVFIGTSAAGVGDRFVTPVSQGGSPEPGVLVEAISAEAILSKDLLHRASPLVNVLLAFGLALLGTLLPMAPGRTLPLFTSGLALAPLMVSAASLHFLNLELAPLSVILALLFVGVVVGADRWRRSKLAMSTAENRISELESLQVIISEARKQDAEARRVVAHELKTPLTSVKGLAQLLAQFDLSAPERNRVARMVVSETARLAQMVDALLDLERLRLRDFGRDAQLLDFSALCAERVDYLRAGAQRDIVADIGTGLQVLGDKALLERVIENLVSNAIKFSPEGSPVRIGLRADGSLAVLEVEDRGPGIPIHERSKIFGRFARGSAQALAPGLGLGLALVAEVVDWHRGAVEADSGTNGGGIFRVRLPMITIQSTG
ncbi:MAG: CHASE2 domain-containing protein [Holophagaceae bacterium]|nr:CHASE2 domain-containing protein [Holophagaceae bacterium]